MQEEESVLKRFLLNLLVVVYIPFHLLYVYFWWIVGIAIACAFLWGADQTVKERNRFRKDCESRGGFMMETSDGYHCLSKEFQK